MWLGEAKWLKTIVAYVQESSRMRRSHEPRGVISYMKKKTMEQPNFRLFRSLHTLQGLDYVHLLRGMEKVEFRDYDRWVEDRMKISVRDWTFVMDVNNPVRRPKTESDERLARSHHLADLIPDYRPEQAVRRAVESATKRVPPNDDAEEAEVDPDQIPVRPAPIVNDVEYISSDEDSDDDEPDNDNSDDGDSDDGSGPPSGSRGSEDRNRRSENRDDGGREGNEEMDMAFDFEAGDYSSGLPHREKLLVIDLTSDDEENEAGGRGPPAEPSLFVRGGSEQSQTRSLPPPSPRGRLRAATWVSPYGTIPFQSMAAKSEGITPEVIDLTDWGDQRRRKRGRVQTSSTSGSDGSGESDAEGSLESSQKRMRRSV